MDKLKSRKLWMALAGIAGNLLLAYSGAITWDVAIQNCGFVIITYIGAQGAVDALKKTL